MVCFNLDKELIFIGYESSVVLRSFVKKNQQFPSQMFILFLIPSSVAIPDVRTARESSKSIRNDSQIFRQWNGDVVNKLSVLGALAIQII